MDGVFARVREMEGNRRCWVGDGGGATVEVWFWWIGATADDVLATVMVSSWGWEARWFAMVWGCWVLWLEKKKGSPERGQRPPPTVAVNGEEAKIFCVNEGWSQDPLRELGDACRRLRRVLGARGVKVRELGRECWSSW